MKHDQKQAVPPLFSYRVLLRKIPQQDLPLREPEFENTHPCPAELCETPLRCCTLTRTVSLRKHLNVYLGVERALIE